MKNLEKKEVIEKLYNTTRKKNKFIYSTIANLLEKSNRQEITLNISEINNKELNKSKYVVIAGKILGKDKLKKDIIVYAYDFSDSAKEVLKDKAKSLIDFCNDKIDYSKITILR